MTHAQHLTESTPSCSPFHDLLDRAINPARSPPGQDVFLFSGNPQESVPRALFLDRRLTPVERNAWQVIKMLMHPGATSTLPTYERLRAFLTSMPCAAQASFETVAKAITLLRLTRWISLVRRRRLPNGQIQSNLYVLHDEPLTPHEAIQLDPNYLSLLSKAIDHNSKAIQRVGEVCFKEIADDPTLGTKSLPTRLGLLTRRMTNAIQPAPPKLSTGSPTTDSEVGQITALRFCYGLASESEAGVKPANNKAFSNPKKVCSSSIFNKTTTIPKERLPIEVPERFKGLSLKQQNLTLSAMHQMAPTLQQQIFLEWNKRCESMSIRKPAAYLLGIVQKALQGELNALDHAPPQPPSPIKPQERNCYKPQSPQVEETPAEREVALQHIARLREIVGRGSLKLSSPQPSTV